MVQKQDRINCTPDKNKNKRPAHRGRRNPNRQPSVPDWQTVPTSIVPVPTRNSFTRNITRTADRGFMTSTASASGFYGFNFLFTDVVDWASFQNTFDQYKINRIDFELRPMNQLAICGQVANPSYLAVAVDFDSSASPGSVNDILQYSNVVVLHPGQAYTLSFVPHVTLGVDNGSVQPAVSSRSPWIDLLTPDVIYYGIRAAVAIAGSNTNPPTWKCFARYHISLRSSR